MKIIHCMVIALMVIFCSPGISPGDDTPMSNRQVINWISSHVPRALDELKRLRREDPGGYAQELENISEQIAYIEMIRGENADLAVRLIEAENLELESWDLADRIAGTRDPGQKQSLTAELHQVLARIFDIRQDERTSEIAALEREVAELKRIMTKRKQQREAIIKKRLEEMTEVEEEGMSWW